MVSCSFCLIGEHQQVHGYKSVVTLVDFSLYSEEEKPFRHSFIYSCRHTHTNTHQCETLTHLPTNQKTKVWVGFETTKLSSPPIHVKYIACNPVSIQDRRYSLSCRVWDCGV